MDRIEREKRTAEAMVRLYCRGHHREEGLCEACTELLAYARGRLDRCPFGAGKTVCGKCTVHCYRPSLRQRMREVMRYSGPRMLLRHPLYALLHLWDGRRRRPGRSARAPDGPR